MMPELVGDGMLVAGDAAALCLAAGIWLEGVNFAIGVGHGRRRGRRSRRCARATRRAAGLAGYRRRLEPNFVLARPPQAAPRARARAVATACSSRTRSSSATSSSGMFTVDNPEPKPGCGTIARAGAQARRHARRRDLAQRRPRRGLQDVRMSDRRRTGRRAGDWPDGRSFEDRMDTVEFRVARAGPHHRRRRLVPRLHHPACVVACPANLFVPTSDGGILFNYEQCFECGTCYLVCNTEGAITWTYPEGGHGVVFRRLVTSPTIAVVPEVGRPRPRGRPAHRAGRPPTTALAGASAADQAALEWALRLAEAWRRRRSSRSPPGRPTPTPSCATRWPPGRARAVRVDLDRRPRPATWWPPALASAVGAVDARVCGDYSLDRGSRLGAGVPRRPARCAQALGLATAARARRRRADHVPATRRLDGGRRERLRRRPRPAVALGRGRRRRACAVPPLAAAARRPRRADRGRRRSSRPARPAARHTPGPYRPRARVLPAPPADLTPASGSCRSPAPSSSARRPSGRGPRPRRGRRPRSSTSCAPVGLPLTPVEHRGPADEACVDAPAAEVALGRWLLARARSGPPSSTARTCRSTPTPASPPAALTAPAGRAAARRRRRPGAAVRRQRRARRVPRHAVDRPGRARAGAGRAGALRRRVRRRRAGQRPRRQRRVAVRRAVARARGRRATASCTGSPTRAGGGRRPRRPHRDVDAAGPRPGRSSASSAAEAGDTRPLGELLPTLRAGGRGRRHPQRRARRPDRRLGRARARPCLDAWSADLAAAVDARFTRSTPTAATPARKPGIGGGPSTRRSRSSPAAPAASAPPPPAALAADGWRLVLVDRCADDPALGYPLATEADLDARGRRCA